MTDWVSWFRYQLKASADGFAWALAQISAQYLTQLPPNPGYLGTWSPARHVWHVTEYERCLVIPIMEHWITGTTPPDDDWQDDDQAWEKIQERGLEALVTKFQATRQRQIDLLNQLTDIDWQAPRETVWGLKPLSMVVTKTFQHTYEHGDTLLRMGLWWEEILQEEQDKKNNTPEA